MRLRPLVPSLLLATVALSCSSLLGDFSSGPGGGSGEGGAGEGGGDDGGPGSDGRSPDGASTDSPAGDSPGSESGADAPTDSGDGGLPLVTLKCTGTKPPQPFLVKSLDGNAGSSSGDFSWGVAAFPTGPTSTRLVAGRFGTDVFSVYELDTSTSPPTVKSLDVPVAASVASSSEVISWVGRLQSGFGVAVSYKDTQGFVDLDLYVFRDSTSIATAPTPVRLYSTQNIASGVPSSILEVGPQEYFATAVVLNTTNSVNALLAGLSTGGAQANMATVDTSSGNAFGGLVSVQSGSNVYVYVVGSTGPAFYALADTGTNNGPRTSIARAGSGAAITESFVDAVPGSAPATTNLAYLELDANEAGTALAGAFFSAASVPQSKLSTLTIADIAFGRTYTDLGSVPGLSNGGMGFYGDDFVAIGPGLDTQSNPTSWVNFLWLDMHGVVRGEQVGVNGILAGLGAKLSQNGRTIVASPGPRSAQQAAWNVAWIEQDRDDAGLFYNALEYQELDCAP
ncbi:MAG TPA: hypothetical protein VIF09_26435 [Polyangiaceae bacterium]